MRMPRKKMNKKVLIGGGIVTFVVGAIAGLYLYAKASMKKIASAMDDDFDIEDDNNIIQNQPDLTKTSTVSKDEETVKIVKVPKFTYYGSIGSYPVQNDIDEIRTKVEELENKINNLNVINCTTLYDDNYYAAEAKDYIDIFGDDGK